MNDMRTIMEEIVLGRADLWDTLSRTMTCGSCGVTVSVETDCTCEVCGRTLCVACWALYGTCKDHREV